jgi:hypothetical protein
MGALIIISQKMVKIKKNKKVGKNDWKKQKKKNSSSAHNIISMKESAPNATLSRKI